MPVSAKPVIGRVCPVAWLGVVLGVDVVAGVVEVAAGVVDVVVGVVDVVVGVVDVVLASTTTVPCMNGWIEQMYVNVPAVLNVCDALLPFSSTPVLKLPLFGSGRVSARTVVHPGDRVTDVNRDRGGTELEVSDRHGRITRGGVSFRRVRESRVMGEGAGDRATGPGDPRQGGCG